MRPRRWVAIYGAVAAAALAAPSAAVLLSFTGQDPFRHEEHVGLFTACVDCHAGVAADDTATFYSIPAEDCADCHNGVELERVVWTGPEKRTSNLTPFRHRVHIAAEQLKCVWCHNVPGAETSMAVTRAAAQPCLECHAKGAEEHLEVGAVECSTCHLTLEGAPDLSVSQIAGFPRPPDHDALDFRSAHGPLAGSATDDCAICHGRESCERCHRNGPSVLPIMALPRDGRIAELVAGGAFGPPTPPRPATPSRWFDPRYCRTGLPCRLRADTL